MVEEGECLVNADCPPGYRCSNGACVKIKPWLLYSLPLWSAAATALLLYTIRGK